MPEGHRHLTHGERCRIGALKESGLSDGAIAARPGRDRTSVWRELRRNGGDGGYSPGEAQGRAGARRSTASSVPRKMTPDRWAHVEGLLEARRIVPLSVCGWTWTDHIRVGQSMKAICLGIGIAAWVAYQLAHVSPVSRFLTRTDSARSRPHFSLRRG